MKQPKAEPQELGDDALLRYARHILLDELGIDGQTRIVNAHVLIVGAGGLGCPTALYLAAAGVGHITLADPDRVELSNLQRQIGHDETSLGELKVESLARRLRTINSHVQLRLMPERLEAAALHTAVADADIVLDCSDNFATRHAINRACVAQQKPLVSGAALRFDGQISVFDSREAQSPCYHCLYPETHQVEEQFCSSTGVFAPLVGLVGSLQATEALKIIAKINGAASLTGRLLTINALSAEFETLRFKKRSDCPVCAQN